MTDVVTLPAGGFGESVAVCASGLLAGCYCVCACFSSFARARGCERACTHTHAPSSQPSSAHTPTHTLADAFADAAQHEDNSAAGVDYVHIRIQQRNGKKSLTTVQVR